MLDIVVMRLHSRLAAARLAVLTLLVRLHQSSFIEGQAIATLSAMTVKFAINNVLTRRARYANVAECGVLVERRQGYDRQGIHSNFGVERRGRRSDRNSVPS
jgi:hypothetical protein